jgi:Spy/CpxP family protein refolding chaperone
MKFTPLALAGAIALSAAGASLAQPAPSTGGAPTEGRGWQRPDPAQMAERLRTVLQLRPEQEPALRALIAASQPDPAKMERRRQDRAEARNLTTPQRLDRAQARMAERQAAFAKRADAIRRFYAQLSPTQQKAFDALHEGQGGKRGGGMHGGRHGGFGHGDGPGRG